MDPNRQEELGEIHLKTTFVGGVFISINFLGEQGIVPPFLEALKAAIETGDLNDLAEVESTFPKYSDVIILLHDNLEPRVNYRVQILTYDVKRQFHRLIVELDYLVPNEK